MVGVNFYVNKVMEYFLLVVAFLGVTGFIIAYNPANYLLFLLFALLQVLRYYNKKLNWGLGEMHFSYILLALYLHMLGDNILRIYYITPWYDKVLHFMNPLIACYVLADSRILPKNKYLSVLVVLGASAFFEITEFAVDRIAGSIMQGVFLVNQSSAVMSPLEDTMYDLLTGFVSANLGYWIYRLRSKKDRKVH